MVIVIVLPAVLFIAAGRERVLKTMFGPVGMQWTDFKHMALNPAPNQFLVCPVNYCLSKPHMISPVFDVSSALLKRHWMNLMATRPRIKLNAADDQAMRYEFVQRSALMRYPDRISVQFISLGTDSSTLAIYSRSQYGYSDLGVNESRIRNWLAELARK